MTENIAMLTRRERRAARPSLARAVSANAGRSTAAALAASGLVITGGVAANASVETPAEEGQDVSAVEINTSELNVERASQVEATTVSSSDETELSFDRPVVSTQPSQASQQAAEPVVEEPVQQEAPAEVEATPASQQVEQPQEPVEQPEETQEQAEEPQQEAETQQEDAETQEAPAETEQTSEVTTAGETEQEDSAPASAGGSSVVSAAYSHIGTPWSQMDCSALVQNAYAAAGISVPRDTYGQRTLPQVSSPQPGDIVISNGAGHAAIYIGNGQVISSTASQGIRVHGLHEGWHNVDSYHRPG